MKLILTRFHPLLQRFKLKKLLYKIVLFILLKYVKLTYKCDNEISSCHL